MNMHFLKNSALLDEVACGECGEFGQVQNSGSYSFKGMRFFSAQLT